MNSIQAFLDYLKLEKQYSAHTCTAYHKDIIAFSEFITLTFESDLKTVTYPMLRSWVVRLSEEQLTNRSINRKVASLKAYYRFLQKIGDIRISPIAPFKSLKNKTKAQVPFSQIEVNSVIDRLSLATDFQSLRDRSIIELIYGTGMRRTELINIKVNDVNLAENTVKVLGKRNKERVIPLIDSLKTTLALYMEVRNPTFPEAGVHLLLTNKGKPTYQTFIYRTVTAYFKEASQKLKASPHMLRHTFATHLLDQGADLNAVKELLGHASLSSTQIYTHSSMAQLQKIYDKAHPRNKDKT